MFVLDTNVLLHDPESIQEFANHDVLIPVTVLEELDKLKRNPSELGKNSRTVVRFLDSLKALGSGDLHQGVRLENGSTIRIFLNETTSERIPFSMSNMDNRIILSAYSLQAEGQRVVFVSKDIAARVKAEALGIEAQDYEKLKFSYDSIYTGVRELEFTKHEIDTFMKDGAIEIDGEDFRPNEYCVLKSSEQSSAVGKYDHKKKKVVSLLKMPNVWGIEPRNTEQKFVMDALLRDDIKLVTLMGPAGTGKTLLSLACGLRRVFDDAAYNKILVSRPIVPLGRDIGYLPGTKEEKLFHWMQPIYDNLEFLCNTKGKETSDTLQWVLDSKQMEMEAVTYIRGRTLPKMYMIIDEAQNLTPHEVKTIISRAGEGTKVILAGDPTQIDNPYLDKDSNGLTVTVAKFNQSPLFGHVFLSKTERSKLSALAAEVM